VNAKAKTPSENASNRALFTKRSYPTLGRAIALGTEKDRQDRRQPGAQHYAYRPHEPLIDLLIEPIKAQVDLAVKGVKTSVDAREAPAELLEGSFEMRHA
jgi:hypothetical protein